MMFLKCFISLSCLCVEVIMSMYVLMKIFYSLYYGVCV